jgi:hypothetical protein
VTVITAVAYTVEVMLCTELVAIGGGVGTAVTGHTVVYNAMVEVRISEDSAGQLVTVAGHLMMVVVIVVYAV